MHYKFPNKKIHYFNLSKTHVDVLLEVIILVLLRFDVVSGLVVVDTVLKEGVKFLLEQCAGSREYLRV